MLTIHVEPFVCLSDMVVGAGRHRTISLSQHAFHTQILHKTLSHHFSGSCQVAEKYLATFRTSFFQ